MVSWSPTPASRGMTLPLSEVCLLAIFFHIAALNHLIAYLFCIHS
jgi:hypothetical protein